MKKIVFISGASRGIGAGIAKDLAAAGFDIWLNYHSSHNDAQDIKESIEKTGRHCTLLPFDVADEQMVQDTLEPLLAENVPYGFVHNAGITHDTLLPMMRREQWDSVLNVHLTSFFLMTRLITRAMIPKREGRIISIASVSGETGQAGQVNYSAAKAGIIGGSKALARELARRNILVNVVSPGLIETDMVKELPRDQILPLIPLARFGSIEEVSGVVRFLLSKEAGYITGQVISVNGGLYM